MPVGTTSEALAAQSAWQKNHGPSSIIRSSSTIKVRRSTRAIYLDAVPQVSSAQIPSPLILTLDAVWGEYLDCVDSNGDHWAVSKDPNLSNAILHASPQGVQFDYTYPHDGSVNILQYVFRKATLHSDSSKWQVEVIVPPWNCPQTTGLSVSSNSPSSLIRADYIPNGTGTAVPQSGDSQTYTAGSVVGGVCQYIETSSRAWCKSTNQSL